MYEYHSINSETHQETRTYVLIMYVLVRQHLYSAATYREYFKHFSVSWCARQV